MAENKTQRTKASVAEFLSSVADPDRRREAKALSALMRKVTGETPSMWGTSIVGFGQTTYTGSGGREVDWFLVGFSPRKAALTLYLLGGLKAHAGLLKELGPHKVGGGCLYLPKPDAINTRVLERLVKASYTTMNSLRPRAAAVKPKRGKQAERS